MPALLTFPGCFLPAPGYGRWRGVLHVERNAHRQLTRLQRRPHRARCGQLHQRNHARRCEHFGKRVFARQREHLRGVAGLNEDFRLAGIARRQHVRHPVNVRGGGQLSQRDGSATTIFRAELDDRRADADDVTCVHCFRTRTARLDLSNAAERFEAVLMPMPEQRDRPGTNFERCDGRIVFRSGFRRERCSRLLAAARSLRRANRERS
jgi:hypothetical protein